MKTLDKQHVKNQTASYLFTLLPKASKVHCFCTFSLKNLFYHHGIRRQCKLIHKCSHQYCHGVIRASVLCSALSFTGQPNQLSPAGTCFPPNPLLLALGQHLQSPKALAGEGRRGSLLLLPPLSNTFQRREQWFYRGGYTSQHYFRNGEDSEIKRRTALRSALLYYLLSSAVTFPEKSDLLRNICVCGEGERKPPKRIIQ